MFETIKNILYSATNVIDESNIAVLPSLIYIDDELITNNELMCIYVEEFICPIHKIKLKFGYISHIDLSKGRILL